MILFLLRRCGWDLSVLLTALFPSQNLICSECGDEFTLQSQLAIHMEEHRQELAGKRFHTCKACKQQFETSAELKEHMKTHYKVRYESFIKHGKNSVEDVKDWYASVTE